MGISPIIIGAMRLGKWGANFSSSEYEKFVDGCLDLGVNDFDHADIYGDYSTEEDFGKLIRKRKDLKNKIQITTKCGIKMPCEARPDFKVKSYDSSPEHIRASVEQSLLNMGLDKIDYLLLHRPDFLMDVRAISECFIDLRNEGKVLNFGISNYSNSQVELLYNEFPISMHQMEISLKHVDAFANGSLDLCQSKNIRVSAWSPMGGGVFFQEGNKEYDDVRKLSIQLGEKYSCNPDQIIIAWLNSHPCGIIPVIGTSKIERVKSSLQASSIIIEKEDWYALLEASRKHEVA